MIRSIDRGVYKKPIDIRELEGKGIINLLKTTLGLYSVGIYIPDEFFKDEKITGAELEEAFKIPEYEKVGGTIMDADSIEHILKELKKYESPDIEKLIRSIGKCTGNSILNTSVCPDLTFHGNPLLDCYIGRCYRLVYLKDDPGFILESRKDLLRIPLKKIAEIF